jgi:hypothetical protein
MPAPPFGASLAELNHERLEWCVSEIGLPRTHVRRGLAELHELLVAHLLQSNAERFNVQFLEADRW